MIFTANVDLDHLMKQCFSYVSIICLLSFYSPSHAGMCSILILQKEVAMPRASLRTGKSYSSSFRLQQFQKLFGILPHGIFVSSLRLFIYLFNYWFILIWNNGYLLYALAYNPNTPVLFYLLFFQVFLVLPIENSFRQLLCPFDFHSLMCFIIIFEHFLTF